MDVLKAFWRPFCTPFWSSEHSQNIQKTISTVIPSFKNVFNSSLMAPVLVIYCRVPNHNGIIELFCKWSFWLGWLIGAPPLVSSLLCLGISTKMKLSAGSKIALMIYFILVSVQHYGGR